MFSSERATTKSERTRELLRRIALRSFLERGYDATTIRLIASEAGVSVGTTNYHFASKNHLVQELYLDVQERHLAAAQKGLEGTTDLFERLAIAYGTGLDQLTPYHRHAPEFLSAAVSPRSPINPLAPESSDALTMTQGVFARAVDGSDIRLSADIRAALPRALVLGHLLLALYWVYDRSPDQRRTRRLLDSGLRLLRLALPLARVPLLRRPIAQLLDLVGQVGA